MSIINGTKYNDALWQLARTIEASAFADLPGVTEVFISDSSPSVAKTYRKIVKRLKKEIERNGVIFDEDNFVHPKTLGPGVMRFSIKPVFR